MAERHPCGHAAVSRGCGGCDPGAVVMVLDDAGRVMWRDDDGPGHPEAPQYAQGRSGHPPCIVDPDEGSHDVPEYQPQVMHRAVCQDCRPILPRAFDTADERDLWVFAHIEHSEHRVFLAPDPTPTSTADEALAAVERAHEALAALVVSLHNDPDHPSKETPR